MTNKDCNELVSEYINWLREQITVSEVNGACEITTPFLDRHNDFLQIYVKKEGDKFFLTDAGYILADLQMSGLDLTPKRQTILQTILRGFGVEQHDSELRVRASKKDFPQQKHSLIQAMLAVNDLFMIAQSRVESFFLEDVEQYLRLNKIRFIPKVNFIGKSGYSHYFDFAIPPSDVAPKRLIKAIDRPSQKNITDSIFSWNDTSASRAADSQAYVFLNDQEKAISLNSLTALESYSITPIPWTKRDEKVELLIA
jgi:hypothetical protein